MANKKNLANVILETPLSSASTSIILPVGSFNSLPSTPFYLTLTQPNEISTLANSEIVLATSLQVAGGDGDSVYDITRAQKGTTAKDFPADSIVGNGVYVEDVDGVDVTVATASGTAAKVGTTTAGNYSPVINDVANVTFSSGLNVNNPTLNIDGSGAKNIRIGNVNVSTSVVGTTSAITLKMWYDGTYWQMYGSLKNDNTTYTEITTAEIDAGTSSTTRLTSGRRSQYTVDKAVATVAADSAIVRRTDSSISGASFSSNVVNTSTDKTVTPAAVKSYVDDRAGSTWVFNETPSGTVDFSNTVFTLASAPTNLILSVNGVTQKPGAGNDYTLSGNTITFASAPVTGSNILATYTTGSSSVFLNGSNSLVSDQTPAGAVNGTNTTFTTANPYIAGSLKVFINGLKQKTGTHFTETTPASGIFTMSDAPLTGDIVTVEYQFVASVTGNADTVDGINASVTPTAGQLLPLDSNAKLPVNILSATPWQVWGISFTNFTPGLAFVEAKYQQIGKTVFFRLKIKLSASTMGTAPRFTLPVEAFAGAGDDEGYVISTSVRILDAATAAYGGFVKLVNNSTTQAEIFTESASGAFVSQATINSTTPMTWANNDTISIIGMYEAA